MTKDQNKKDMGLIGLAVMGRNLALNIADNGFSVAVYNRTQEKTRSFLEHEVHGKDVTGAETPAEFCAQLKTPRKIIMMVQAGPAVDTVIESLEPHLEPGDILIDGGNSHFDDTQRRFESLKAAGIRFIGMGVSGGEEGARRGPSLMPGGDESAWDEIRPLVEAVAAKAPDGVACTGWVGRGGAGHFVKMVHNGIEYGDMQIIAEVYDFFSRGMGLHADEIASFFARWNRGRLESYLMEITADVLAYQLPGEKGFLVDQILDRAGQKGTGRWTAVNALEAGEPVTLISEAVMARFLSAQKALREKAAALLSGPEGGIIGPVEEILGDAEMALYGAKLVSYAQGFQLMRRVSRARDWSLDPGAIAQMWRGGCIIRSAFLGKIKEAYERNPHLEHLLFDSFFHTEISRIEEGWRRFTVQAMSAGIPVPALSAALSYYDGLRSRDLPANLIQGQRDYFGAHTYEKKDQPAGKFFHADWSGDGGETPVN